MTMTLAHPTAEDLGRFVEGTLDDAARAAVVAHIADCDDCRIVVVDTSEFIEPELIEPESIESEFIEPARAGRPWWLATAAAVVLVAAVGTFTYTQRDDRQAKLNKDYAQQKRRPIESRLSGTPYVKWSVNRGGSPNEEEEDSLLTMMKGDAASAAELSGNDAKTLHTRGLGLLLEGSKESIDDSLTPLRAAAEKDLESAGQTVFHIHFHQSNARYQNDLAAALIAAGRSGDAAKLQLAVDAADQALKIDPHSLDALFNRALALELLDRKPEAIAAYNRYLALDSSSKWADEVRQQHLDNLRF